MSKLTQEERKKIHKEVSENNAPWYVPQEISNKYFDQIDKILEEREKKN